MRIIGDIGGTNVRFALANDKGEIFNHKNFLKKDFETVKEAVLAYKKDWPEPIKEVYLAVNAPVANNRPYINANNWGYEEADFEQAFAVEKVRFFNDLQAHAMSLPFLENEDKITLKKGLSDDKGVIAVVGPGTGLGMAFGVYDEQHCGYNIFPSEGGNQIVAGADEKQIEIILKVKKFLPSVRFQDVCSGKGIKKTYKALFGQDKEVEEIMSELSNGCSKGKETFTSFCEFLGTFLHNVSISLLPSGGIYIVGGVLTRPENAEFLQKTKFLEYYNSQELYTSQYLDNYPIYLVTHYNPALLALAKV